MKRILTLIALRPVLRKNLKSKGDGAAGLVFTLAGSVLLCAHSSENRFFFLNDMSLNKAAMASAVFLLIKENDAPLRLKFGRLVSFTQKDVFGIYLTHALWLFFLTDAVRELLHPAGFIPLASLAIFVASLFSSKILRKIPLLRKVV